VSNDLIVHSESPLYETDWSEALAPVRPQLKEIHYLEKAQKAYEVGLCDAAVNYVWDSAINDLRTKVEAYGAAIFLALSLACLRFRQSPPLVIV